MTETNREYIRVNAACPILYRVLDAEENVEQNADFEKSRFDPLSLIGSHQIASTLDVVGDPKDGQMLELLLCIDWKLNYLIKTQSREEDKKLFPHEGIVNDLSGSGLGFSSERAEAVGTKLQFKLILPVLPFSEMHIDGTVIRSVEKGCNEDSTLKYEIGLEYSEIRAADREAIFRFIVKRERQIRLEKRAQKDSK